MSGPKLVRVYEPFTCADGVVRWAWVTWRIGDGERRAVSVELEGGGK